MSDPFDLTSQPWLPCERLDGARVELSTRDALAEAHRLRALVDPSPLVLAALHRHLLAVLHRVHAGPRTLKDWGVIARAGSFDAGRVGGYLDSVRGRMCLFHPTHPFAQTPGLVGQFEATPIDELSAERAPWGGARELFQHRPASYRAVMSPAEAARALLVHHAFATGGLVKKPNEPISATASPLVRCAVVVLRGETLFQTLVANLLKYDPDANEPIACDANDAPSWEQDPPPTQLRRLDEPKVMPRGWLDLLTWLSRRIELVRQRDEVVGFVRAVGKGLDERAPQDPMVTYKCDEKKGIRSLGLDPDRAFWRDANAIFEAERNGNKFIRPRAIRQACEPAVRAWLGPAVAFSIELYGLSAEKSKLLLLRTERVGAALGHFGDPDAGDVVVRALDAAEGAVAVLKGALFVYARHALSEGGREPRANDVDALMKALGAEPAVWSALGVEFASLLRGLDEPDREAPLGRFKEAVRRVVLGAFEGATSGADGTARSLKARAMGERSLRSKLSGLAGPRVNVGEETPP